MLDAKETGDSFKKILFLILGLTLAAGIVAGCVAGLLLSAWRG